MAKLSLKQAAEWAGTTKPTVLKHLQAGKVSAEKDAEGRWWFDVSELVRAYGEPKNSSEAGNASEPDTLNERNPHGNSSEAQLISELRERIAELKADKDELRRQVDEERAERTRLLTLVDEHASMVRLLTDERRAAPIIPPAPPAAEPAPPTTQPEALKPKGVWAWLMGR